MATGSAMVMAAEADAVRDEAWVVAWVVAWAVAVAAWVVEAGKPT